MTRARCPLVAPEGFSLLELLIAFGLVAGVVMAVLLPVSGGLRVARVQPDVADLDQRLRVAAGELRAALEAAGSGPPAGEEPGALSLRWPAIYPHRRGADDEDSPDSAHGDRLTVISAVTGTVAPPITMPMAGPQSLIAFAHGPPCPYGDPRCGFRRGDLAAIDDRLGRADVFRVAAAGAGVLDHTPPFLSQAYAPADNARVLRLAVRHFRHDAARRQLRVGAGGAAEAPLLDDVVGMRVRYVGSARGPAFPRPPLGTETCLFAADGTSRLPSFGAGSGGLVELPLSSFADGPFCGEGRSRYDADLHRVRRVIVSVTVGWPEKWPDDGARTGLERAAHTREVLVDVSPRNLSLP